MRWGVGIEEKAIHRERMFRYKQNKIRLSQLNLSSELFSCALLVSDRLEGAQIGAQWSSSNQLSGDGTAEAFPNSSSSLKWFCCLNKTQAGKLKVAVLGTRAQLNGRFSFPSQSVSCELPLAPWQEQFASPWRSPSGTLLYQESSKLLRWCSYTRF